MRKFQTQQSYEDEDSKEILEMLKPDIKEAGKVKHVTILKKAEKRTWKRGSLQEQ